VVAVASAVKKRHAGKQRCRWADSSDPDYVRYHDEEWGRAVHDDRLLFEMLIL
jgi:DNA-3-methyladenine glycosylase I